MAGETDDSLAESAASYIGRSADPNQSVDGRQAEIDRQADLLVKWAWENQAILRASYFIELVRLATNTAEHEIFYRSVDNRAVKRTHPGAFGVTPDAERRQRAATPLFYLQRLALMNRLFDSAIRFEGISFGESFIIGKATGPSPCMVISQPWHRAANPRNPHPTELEIREFMESIGFEQQPNSYYGWFNSSSKILVIDARVDNFIKTMWGVIPIDLVVSQFHG